MRKLLTVVFLSLSILIVNAQQQGASPLTNLPIDPQVRYGKLDNGLTYYVRHNAQPENRADFYIAQKVGSMQEEENQRGLAHFLEHMAFNGTKHYPGRKTLVNYLETVGAKFGLNINAYTSFDETVYNLSNIPVNRGTVVDSCLLILHDWSSFLTLEDAEIDKERPIIKEEWRTRDDAQMRILEKQLPLIYADSKYANRLPIGTMEVVENFDYQVLKDYYHKWYRPDLQAIIVVGDIDAEQVENKIKELFSDIPAPVDAAERVYFPVPDNDAPIVFVGTDKEAMNSQVMLFHKHDVVPAEVRGTLQGYVANVVKVLSSLMMVDRFNEIAQGADAPFVHAYGYDGEYIVSKTKDAWTSYAISKDGKEKESLEVLVRENERVRKHGFTESELERAKANILQTIENQYNNRNEQESRGYVTEYVRHFSSGDAIPGIETEYTLVQQMLPMITVPMVNGMISSLIEEKNMVVTLTGPEKEGRVYPTEAELLDLIEKIRFEELEAYAEEVSNEPLIKVMPKAGKVVKEEKNTKLDATVWTLSNGMKVVYKKTDFKADEIIVTSTAKGGTSYVSDEDIHSAQLAGQVSAIGGLGEFSATELRKRLAGNSAEVSPVIGAWEQGITGSSSIKDMETMLQLIYLHFTSVRKDEDVFQSRMTSLKGSIANFANNPQVALFDTLSATMYPGVVRKQRMTLENVEKINYDKVLDIYKSAFANPGAFVFTFVGSIDEAQLKPLVEQYLASLPSGDKNATYNKNLDVSITNGEFVKKFSKEISSPKTSVFFVYSGTLNDDLKTNLSLNALKQILDIVYTRTVREEAGGTYGVGVGANISRLPKGESTLKMMYDTDVEKVEVINPIIERELKRLMENGPEEQDFVKVKEYMMKQHQENIKTNNYWAGTLDEYYSHGDDNYSEYKTIVSGLTTQDIKDIANKLLSQKNKVEVILLPK